ncbi:MAG TPA: GNAT family N-acetyltransferase [Symbiobacteriaceae bacterium]
MEAATYRSAREDDLYAAARIHAVARNDMLTRNGRTTPPDDLEGDAKNFRHVLHTGIFEVAEQDGRVAAVCNAVVRDGIWFLSSFWVLPELQNQHIGGPLLRRVWRLGEAAGARIFCVWASVDNTAMATYFKLGMLPGTQLLNFAGDAGKLVLPETPGQYKTRPLAVAEAAAIDRAIRGTPRAVDHRFWLADETRQGRLVLKDGDPCGYYYTTPQGAVLPAAWLDPADGEAVLSLACRDGVARGGAAALRLPGYNHLGIGFALRAGMTLRGFSHFLTTASFGRLDQYAASGPLLF